MKILILTFAFLAIDASVQLLPKQLTKKAFSLKDTCAKRDLCYLGTNIACQADRIKLCPGGKMIKFTTGEKLNIVNEHNKLRHDLATGKVSGFQPAARMGAMTWDAELAQMVDINIRKCVYEHDICHNTENYPMSGQNIAYIKGYNHGTFNRAAVVKEFDTMINDWFLEYMDADMNIIRNFKNNGKPELYIKEEQLEQNDGFSFYSSDSDYKDQDDDDDDDSLHEDDKSSTKETNNRELRKKGNDENKDEVKRQVNVVDDSNTSDSDTYIPKNTNHKCLKCNKYCASSSSLKRHEQTVHTEVKDRLRQEKRLKSKPKPKPFKCDVCKKPFETLFRKNRHLVTHDQSRVRIIACRQCPERFTEYEEYQKHKVVHNKSFECDVCHKSFSTKYFLKLHYPIHMETKPFQCDRCSRSFSQASTLRRHIYLHEAEKKFMCELCGKRFHAQYLVKMHILHAHTEYRKYICAQCPKRFSSTTDLTIHTNVHHSDVNPYKCETCLKTFTHPSALRRHHRKVHTGFGEFVCQHCNKRFVRSELMEKHINTVHSLKSIKCELCPASFNSLQKLKKHSRVHKEPFVKPAIIVHRCMECHQPFNDHEKLARHLEMSHNPNNPFKCEVCLKRLSSQSALCRHMKLLHTQQTKSFKCDFCGKSFGRLEHFKNHTLTLHNPDNPFKCGTCQQTYSTKQSLDKHITRVHETERTMLCEFCNKAFSKRYILQRHIRNFHDTDSGINSGVSYNLVGHQMDK